MRENRALYLNLFVHFSFIFLLTAAQCGLWFKLFNGFPAPFFWILYLCYVSLYRENEEAFILGALGYLAVMSFTIIPHGTLFLIGFSVCLFCHYIKDRIFWPGPSYYLLIVLISSFSSFVIYYLLTIIFEETHLPQVRWLYLFLQIFLSTLVAPVFYFIYMFFSFTVDI